MLFYLGKGFSFTYEDYMKMKLSEIIWFYKEERDYLKRINTEK